MVSLGRDLKDHLIPSSFLCHGGVWKVFKSFLPWMLCSCIEMGYMCHHFRINSLKFVEGSAKINNSSLESIHTVPENTIGSRELLLTV